MALEYVLSSFFMEYMKRLERKSVSVGKSPEYLIIYNSNKSEYPLQFVSL